MKYLTAKRILWLSVLCLVIEASQPLLAQGIKVGDTSYTKWKNALVQVQSQYASEGLPVVKDTLYGTAFLITDHKKLYMVTTKHLIQADLYSKNQQIANESVFLRIFGAEDTVKLSGLSDKDHRRGAVVFSNDEQDIAVISLQKQAFKGVVNYLLASDQPLPLSLIDTTENHLAGEPVINFGLISYPMPANIPRPPKLVGKPLRMNGMGITPFAIDENVQSASLFTIRPNSPGYPDKMLPGTLVNKVYPGNAGAIVTVNDKLIGMLTNATGITTNHEVVQNPYYAIPGGSVIKARFILFYLRKLQQIEEDPAFDQ